MAFSYPTYGSVNFGFANTDANAFRAFCTGGQDATGATRRQFVLFNGVDGKWLLNLGVDPGQVVWRVTALFKTVADKVSWEEAIKAAANTDAKALTFRGNSWPSASIQAPQEIQLIPCLATWAVGCEYAITFDVLSLPT